MNAKQPSLSLIKALINSKSKDSLKNSLKKMIENKYMQKMDKIPENSKNIFFYEIDQKPENLKIPSTKNKLIEIIDKKCEEEQEAAQIAQTRVRSRKNSKLSQKIVNKSFENQKKSEKNQSHNELDIYSETSEQEETKFKEKFQSKYVNEEQQQHPTFSSQHTTFEKHTNIDQSQHKSIVQQKSAEKSDSANSEPKIQQSQHEDEIDAKNNCNQIQSNNSTPQIEISQQSQADPSEQQLQDQQQLQIKQQSPQQALQLKRRRNKQKKQKLFLIQKQIALKIIKQKYGQKRSSKLIQISRSKHLVYLQSIVKKVFKKLCQILTSISGKKVTIRSKKIYLKPFLSNRMECMSKEHLETFYKLIQVQYKIKQHGFSRKQLQSFYDQIHRQLKKRKTELKMNEQSIQPKNHSNWNQIESTHQFKTKKIAKFFYIYRNQRVAFEKMKEIFKDMNGNQWSFEYFKERLQNVLLSGLKKTVQYGAINVKRFSNYPFVSLEAPEQFTRVLLKSTLQMKLWLIEVFFSPINPIVVVADIMKNIRPPRRLNKKYVELSEDQN